LIIKELLYKINNIKIIIQNVNKVSYHVIWLKLEKFKIDYLKLINSF